MWLSAPAHSATDGDLQTASAAAKGCIVRIAQSLRLHHDPTVANQLRNWNLATAIHVGVLFLQVFALIRAEFKIVRSVVGFIAVFVMNNLGWQKWSPNHSKHHKSVFARIAMLIRQRVVATDPRVDITALVYKSTRLPLRVRRTFCDYAHVVAMPECAPLALVSAHVFIAAASAKRWSRILVSHVSRLLCGRCGQGLAERFSVLRVPSILPLLLSIPTFSGESK
jgi:hypothetical protein